MKNKQQKSLQEKEQPSNLIIYLFDYLSFINSLFISSFFGVHSMHFQVKLS